MNHAVFGKSMEYLRKHRDIKLVTTEERNNYLLSESSYYITRFSSNFSAIEMKRTLTVINKPVDLGLSILEISKLVIYEF